MNEVPKPQRTRRTKAERFKVAAERHATRALSAMKRLEDLADNRRFDREPHEEEDLVNALQAAVDRVAQAFNDAREGEVEPRFRFE